MDAPPSQLEPTRLGKYRLIERLGEGGMATVHVAIREDDERLCVIKRLHVEFEGNDVVLARFMREARIASRLNHPNIARVFGAGVEEGHLCLEGEYVRGETLERLMTRAIEQRGILPYETSVHIVIQALTGLEHAHSLSENNRHLGIVHRDLSPRNIMVSYDGVVKLIDFGIAKGDVDEFKTTAGALLGTPYYMSPEQATGQPVDLRSDIYTLGVVLFELLTGQRLVQADGRALVLLAVARQPAPPISAVNALAPTLFDQVVARALNKQPQDRYPSAAAFRAALEAAAQHLPRTTFSELGHLTRRLFSEREASSRALVERLAPIEANMKTPAAFSTTDFGVNSDAISRPVRAPRRRSSRLFPLISSGALLTLAGLTCFIWLQQDLDSRSNRIQATTNAPALGTSPHARDRTRPPAPTGNSAPSGPSARSARADRADRAATDAARVTHKANSPQADNNPASKAKNPRRVARTTNARASVPTDPAQAPRDQGTDLAAEVEKIRGLLRRASDNQDMSVAFEAKAQIDAAATDLPPNLRRRILADTGAALWSQNVDDVVQNLRRGLDRLAKAQRTASASASP